MLLPSDFKQTIADTFYDKTIVILGSVETEEADGAKKKTSGEPTGSFKGNCRLVNFKKIQKEFGLDYQIDIAITCDTDTPVAVGDHIQYAGVKYEVSDALPTDSHILIVGVKWQRQ